MVRSLALVKGIGALLKQNKQFIRTAESCTGGGLATMLTSVAGASAWYDGSLVTYSNALKSTWLDVDPALLNKVGAVSEEVALSMAEGLIRDDLRHWGIAITGVAGPGGGTLLKPVGTVWFAWAHYEENHLITKAIVKHFEGNRRRIRCQAIDFALSETYEYLSSQR